jgi:hypothetical protein
MSQVESKKQSAETVGADKPTEKRHKKLSYEVRKAQWLEEMDKWEQRTENYKDYALNKAMQLDKKYSIERRGLVAIRKSKKHKRTAIKQLAAKLENAETTTTQK